MITVCYLWFGSDRTWLERSRSARRTRHNGVFAVSLSEAEGPLSDI
jgi:hypothetical protein